jgi:hypothetical protein
VSGAYDIAIMEAWIVAMAAAAIRAATQAPGLPYFPAVRDLK